MYNVTFDQCKQYFPLKQARHSQQTAIEFAVNAFNSGKKFVILELPVGCGKSAVGVTIANYFNSNPIGNQSGAYILTTQKVLQDQYVSDFGPKSLNILRSIKSSSNYQCLHNRDQTCAESRRVLFQLREQLAGTEYAKVCGCKCSYKLDKDKFIQSLIGVTNFSYFLAETAYKGDLTPRQLLIIDEAHNIESELSKVIEISFSEKVAKKLLGCKLMKKQPTQENVYKWLTTSYVAALKKYIANLQIKLSNALKTANTVLGKEYAQQFEKLDKHICKVNRFIDEYNQENWILNVSIDEKTKLKKFEFKPIDVSTYGNDKLYKFGEKVLLMSATIINKEAFCESIGIPMNDVEFLSLPSTFPVENRLIHFMPVGSMSKSIIDITLPKMAKAIEYILDNHQEKGIIHTVNYRIAQYIVENVKSDRLLLHDATNREDVLKKHIECNENTVLISPSMTEGVDLYDQNSRFQIICKVPFPYLGDEMVKRRMERSKIWYNFQTAKTLIQSLGRSVRNENDYAISYILDNDWEKFYKLNQSIFPNDFKQLLRM